MYTPLQRLASPSIFTLAVLLICASIVACADPNEPEPAVSNQENADASGSADDNQGTGEANATPPVVSRSLEHHGSAILERSNVQLTVSSKSGSFGVIAQPGDVFDYTIFSEADGEARIHRHTNKPGEPEFSLTVGDEPVVDPDPERVKNFVSARIYFLFFPLRLEDPNTTLTDLGLENWDGRSLQKVRLSFASGTSTNAEESFLFWFDPENAELEQFAYSFDGGVRFRKLVNKRRIEGVLIADQENYAHNGDVKVDWVTPESAPGMELLSTVKLTDVSITPR